MSDEQQIITPNPMSFLQATKTPQIPPDLVHHPDLEPQDVVTYYCLVELAEGNAGVLELPPREVMAERCKCSVPSYNKSLHRLEKADYIKINDFNQGEKTTRRRILLKYDQLITTTVRQISEMMEAVLGSRRQDYITFISDPTSKIPLEIKKSCTKKDKSGRSLSDMSDKFLIEASGNAPVEDISEALHEIQSFNTPSAQITSIVALYKKRFKNGKIDPERKGRVVVNAGGQRNSTGKSESIVRSYQQEAVSLGANMCPTELFTEEMIDNLAKRFNAHEWILSGDLPVYMLAWKDDLRLVTNREDRVKVKLHEQLECVKIKSGFWSIRRVVGHTIRSVMDKMKLPASVE